MKIVLVFPPFYLSSMYNLPPLGLLNIAGAMRKEPHTVAVLDMVLALRKGALKFGRRIYDDCAEMIADYKPDVVGFSAQCTTYPSVLHIAEKIKSAVPSVKIILGGHNASFVDSETLYRYHFIDFIVRGEAEITFPDLIRAVSSDQDLERVRGISFRRGEDVIRNQDRGLVQDLDSLPLPDYSLAEPLVVYRDACGLPRSIAILEVGRGCPHNCIYCSESVLWGRKTRTFSISRIVSEMEHLRDQEGAECFVLAYDQFTAQRRFVESFCRSVIDKGLSSTPWYCISRLDTVDRELLGLMKEAGCESMCYGIDSGSKKTLSFIRKKIDRDILFERVAETTEQGMIPTLSFVIGFPEEERSDIDETLFMALRTGIVGNSNPLIQMPTVLPGTDLHRRYGGELIRKVDTYFSLGLEFDEGGRLSEDEKLINSDPLLFSSFYNVRCRGVSLEELSTLAGYFPLMVQFFPRSFLLLSLEYRFSVSSLFIEWISYVGKMTSREAPEFNAHDLYLHFAGFVEIFRKRKAPLRLDYLGDVLKYEKLCLESAGRKATIGSIKAFEEGGILYAVPSLSKGLIIERFDFDLPVIILDLKAGKFLERYEASPSNILFRHVGDQLETAQIDDDTKDFLTLCNGVRSLKDIIKRMKREGKEIKKRELEKMYIEVFRTLCDEGYLKCNDPGPIQ